MALNKDTVSINLAKGIDTSNDPKVASSDQSAVLENARFTKDFRLVKRFGLSAQSQTFQGDPGFTNPVAFASGSAKSKTFAHEDQLCVINNGSLFSQYHASNKWIFKGTCVPLTISSYKIDTSATFTDVGTTAGITTAVAGATVVVFEESTQNIIAKTTLAGGETAIRVLAMSATTYIVTASGSTLYARPINLSTGAVGSTTTLTTGYQNQAPVNIAYTSAASNIGEAAFIQYTHTTGLIIRVIPWLSSGSIAPLGELTSSVVGIFTAVTCAPDARPNQIYFARVTGNVTIVSSYTFTAGAWTNVYTTTTGSSSNFVTHQGVTLALSPVDDATLYYFYDTVPTRNFTLPFSDDNYTTMIPFSSAGVAGSSVVYSYGTQIVAQAIRDTQRNTVYLPTYYQSTLQTTVFLMDVLEGRATPFNYGVGKTLYGLGAVPPTVINSVRILPQVLPYEPGVYRTINNGYFVDLNFHPQSAQQTRYFAKTNHITGGILWIYDGTSVNEHNFFLAAEQIADAASSAAATVTVNQVGDGSHRQDQTFTLWPGLAWANSLSQNNYLLFSSTSTNYYVWFLVDGTTGNNPNVGGRTGIQVNILSTDTGADVAQKAAAAIVAAGAAVIVSGGDNGTFTSDLGLLNIRNNADGAVTAPSIGGVGLTGSLSAGSYQYCHVYKWTDRNGQIYRSAPSVPISVTAASGNAGYVNAWAPPITNKVIADCRVEIYRTQVNQTTFHLLTTVNMPSSGVRVAVIDQQSDTQLASSLLLYTNGGILENSPNIGSCTTVAFFKERLLAGGLDADPFGYLYSKSNIIGEPVNFAQELTSRIDADQNPLTAIAVMDDKIFTFKSPLIYVQSGDGANDLGEGSTLSQPFLIASDTGTDDPNSIVLYPNGLMFKGEKGIYGLNRSLGVEYTGIQVEDYNAFDVSGAVLKQADTEIIFTLSDASVALVYNYYYKRWDTFTNHQADSATLWDGTFVLVKNSGVVYLESEVFYDYNGTSNVSYSMMLETPWLKLKGIQDFQRIYSLEFLGDYRSPHSLQITVSYDYDTDPAQANTYTFNATEIMENPGTFPGGSVYQFLLHLSRQKCEAIKIRITEVAVGGTEESLVLNDMSAVVGLKKGLNKLPARKQI